jgi:hypothetical protein
MARSVEVIKKEITDKFIVDPTIHTAYDLDPDPLKTFEDQFSKVNIESIIFYICAYVIHALEVLFDTHKSEVNQIVDNERYGKLGWYEIMALLYQQGGTRVEGFDYYDNSALTSDEIEAQRVVKFAAAGELPDGAVSLRMAKGETGALVKLTSHELAGVNAFFNARGGAKPAGVRVNCISIDADLLKLSLSIQYDALIIDADGKRLDGTNDTPIIEAINSYLSSINFSGEYSNMRLVDALQSVEGVKIVDLNAAWSKYSEYDYTLIQSRYPPEAGFMQLDSDNSLITYMPYV